MNMKWDNSINIHFNVKQFPQDYAVIFGLSAAD